MCSITQSLEVILLKISDKLFWFLLPIQIHMQYMNSTKIPGEYL